MLRRTMLVPLRKLTNRHALASCYGAPVRGCASQNNRATPTSDTDDISSILSLAMDGAYTTVNDFMKHNAPFSSALLKNDVLLTWSKLGTYTKKKLMPRWHDSLDRNPAFKRAAGNALALDVLKSRGVVTLSQFSRLPQPIPDVDSNVVDLLNDALEKCNMSRRDDAVKWCEKEVNAFKDRVDPNRIMTSYSSLC
jgi:hypothetical protein